MDDRPPLLPLEALGTQDRCLSCAAVQPTVSLLLYTGYVIVAHRGFYRRGAGSLLRTLAAYAISLALFFVSIIAAYTCSVVVLLVWRRMAAG